MSLYESAEARWTIWASCSALAASMRPLLRIFAGVYFCWSFLRLFWACVICELSSGRRPCISLYWSSMVITFDAASTDKLANSLFL